MSVIFIIAVCVIIFGIIKHDDVSYKKYYERSVVNSQHPDWYPKCGINFLEKDPKWFIDNGYGKWVDKNETLG